MPGVGSGDSIVASGARRDARRMRGRRRRRRGGADATGERCRSAGGRHRQGRSLREAAQKRTRLTITVDDSAPGRFRYRAPRTVRGGLVEIRLRNVGDAPQKAQLWRIDGDHTVEEALRVRHPLPGRLRYAGGVGLTEPGATGSTLQALPAGNYYVAGHAGAAGPRRRVRGDGAAGRPAASARASPRRGRRLLVQGLRPAAGCQQRRLRQHRAGASPCLLYADPRRQELADVKRFFTTQTSTGPPPIDTEVTRETAVLEGRQRQVTQLKFTAGRYAVICFVRNRAGGRPHIELGMINEVTVR